LRRLFLSNRFFFLTVKRLSGHHHLGEQGFDVLARSLSGLSMPK
jgi:hypothetical protein